MPVQLRFAWGSSTIDLGMCKVMQVNSSALPALQLKQTIVNGLKVSGLQIVTLMF